MATHIDSSGTAIPNAVLGVLCGGLTAGALDLTYAISWSAYRGVTAVWVLQSVAAGLLGKAAFDGGAATAALGTIAHFSIALGAATVFALAYRRSAFMRSQTVLAGLVFGIGVFIVMNFVVLPLSAYPFPVKFTTESFVRNLAAHMILFGLPVAFLARRFAR